MQEQGYDAYAVGGCVRDSLLDRSPQIGILHHFCKAGSKGNFQKNRGHGHQHEL